MWKLGVPGAISIVGGVYGATGVPGGGGGGGVVTGLAAVLSSSSFTTTEPPLMKNFSLAVNRRAREYSREPSI